MAELNDRLLYKLVTGATRSMRHFGLGDALERSAASATPIGPCPSERPMSRRSEVDLMLRRGFRIADIRSSRSIFISRMTAVRDGAA